MLRKGIFLAEAVIAILVVVLLTLSFQSAESTRTMLMPAFEKKAEILAASLADQVSLALSYGIALDGLVGTNSVFADALAASPGFTYAGLRTPGGRLLAATNADGAPLAVLPDPGRDLAVAAPVTSNGATVAEVVIGVPRSMARELAEAIWVDVGILLLSSILITIEAVLFAFRRVGAVVRRSEAGRQAARGVLPPEAGRTLVQRQAVLLAATRAARDRAAAARLRLIDPLVKDLANLSLPNRLLLIRAPLFLVFFSESLTRAFLPSYAERLSEPLLGYTTEQLASLPITLFMAINAFALLSFNPLTERIGRARALRIGTLVLIAGYVGTALSSDLLTLLAARGVTAFGYGLVFVSAQGLIIDGTTTTNRAQGMSAMVLAIMIAGVCGPPLGGILADRIGVPLTFVAAGGVAIAAYGMIWLAVSTERTAARRTVMPDLKVVGVFFARVPLFLLVVGCAIPAKLTLIGVGYYAVPLYLSQQGIDASVIGRVLMLYAVPQLILTTYVARLADSSRQHGLFVVSGGLLSGIGLTAILFVPSPYGSAIGMLMLGIGQSLSLTPQSAMVGILGAQQAPDVSPGNLYGAFRFLERLGNAAGPIFVAVLWGMFGFDAAMLTFCAILVGGAGLFGLQLGLGRAMRVYGARHQAAASDRSISSSA